jgi:hypothetical protein
MEEKAIIAWDARGVVSLTGSSPQIQTVSHLCRVLAIPGCTLERIETGILAGKPPRRMRLTARKIVFEDEAQLKIPTARDFYCCGDLVKLGNAVYRIAFS